MKQVGFFSRAYPLRNDSEASKKVRRCAASISTSDRSSTSDVRSSDLGAGMSTLYAHSPQKRNDRFLAAWLATSSRVGRYLQFGHTIKGRHVTFASAEARICS